MQTSRFANATAAFIAVLLSVIPAQAQQSPSATEAWPQSSLREQGMDASPLEQLAARARSGEFGNVDRMVVVRNGYLVLDERFDTDYRLISRGKTGALGCGLDACAGASELHAYNYLHPDYHPWWQGRDVHTLQSVTKSVTATAIGVAIQRGDITNVNVPLLSFFDAYDLAGVDPRLRRATLEDLLTMRTGIEWHETDRPLDETNTTYQLEHSDDWIRFTLAQPSDAEPGTKWVYNSGGSQLMSEVIRSATGEHVDSYAERHLFAPLGIRDYHWKETPTGHPDTEGGLYLEARDLAKIGQLYLDDGAWDGRRILPAGWAKEATGKHVERINENPNSPGYGYQWWRFDRRGTEVWAGNGFGGQFLVIIPAVSTVGVVNGWNVFGAQVPGILSPFIDALLTAAGIAVPSGI
jgi:CubicO group peptidase (beta-lactamase class C family)